MAWRQPGDKPLSEPILGFNEISAISIQILFLYVKLATWVRSQNKDVIFLNILIAQSTYMGMTYRRFMKFEVDTYSVNTLIASNISG